MNRQNSIDRRRSERFVLQPMYTSVLARAGDDPAGEALHGHAYDISEHGVRIELDQPPPDGQQIDLEIALPCQSSPVAAQARVVWMHDQQDDPGPRRMAMEFTQFRSSDDRLRLVSYLGAGQLRRAA